IFKILRCQFKTDSSPTPNISFIGWRHDTGVGTAGLNPTVSGTALDEEPGTSYAQRYQRLAEKDITSPQQSRHTAPYLYLRLK
ncbi:MAG: hypothetical protein E7K47_21485, partial [Acidovorax sp.]|nr:hypothetical protein [Acidovorax sp.]